MTPTLAAYLAPLPVSTRAIACALATSNAYSYPTYGATAWRACAALLLRRGYNLPEAEAILRSKLTRLAADGRRRYYAHATSQDLGRFLDSFDVPTLRDLIDDYVLGIMTEEDETPIPPARILPFVARQVGC